MDLAALRSRLARRWWVVAAVAAITVLGAATAAAGESDGHQTTVRFVMRPDAAISNNDLPGTLEALRSDGPLIQTVVDVLDSRAMLERAAVNANVELEDDYTVEATGRPGSTLIDSTLAGPDQATVNSLAGGYTTAASDYVASSYSAYVLERLSVDPGEGTTGPSTPQVVLLALLVGTALGVALVAAELGLEPRLRALLAREEASGAVASPATGSHRVASRAGAALRARQASWRRRSDAKGQEEPPSAIEPDAPSRKTARAKTRPPDEAATLPGRFREARRGGRPRAGPTAQRAIAPGCAGEDRRRAQDSTPAEDRLTRQGQDPAEDRSADQNRHAGESGHPGEVRRGDEVGPPEARHPTQADRCPEADRPPGVGPAASARPGRFPATRPGAFTARPGAFPTVRPGAFPNAFPTARPGHSPTARPGALPRARPEPCAQLSASSRRRAGFSGPAPDPGPTQGRWLT